MLMQAILKNQSPADRQLGAMALVVIGGLVFLRVMGAPLHWTGVSIKWSLLVWTLGLMLGWWIKHEYESIAPRGLWFTSLMECYDERRPSVSWMVFAGAAVVGAGLALAIGQWLMLVGWSLGGV